MRERNETMCGTPSSKAGASSALVLSTVLWTAAALAQGTVGDVLDSGARKLSPDEFKEELVQRTVVGPTATGGTMELIYAPNGFVAGSGVASPKSRPLDPMEGSLTVRGEWKINDSGAVCTVLRVFMRAPYPPIIMAPRC